jgi:hypothetical protein
MECGGQFHGYRGFTGSGWASNKDRALIHPRKKLLTEAERKQDQFNRRQQLVSIRGSGSGTLFGQLGVPFALHFLAPGKNKKQPNTGADCGIGDVKGGKTYLMTVAGLEKEVDEVDNVLSKQAINQVTDNSAEDETERDLAQVGASIEMLSKDKKDQQSDEGDDGKSFIVVLEHAPGSACIAPMNKFKETWKNDFLMSVGEIAENNKLSDLIKEYCRSRDDGHSPVRFRTHISRYFIP